MKVVLREVFCILTLVLSHSHSVTNQTNCCFSYTTDEERQLEALPAGSRGTGTDPTAPESCNGTF